MTSLRKPGEVIGNYRIVRELGTGGMGIVYEAFDTTLERPIALKIIKPSDHYSEDKVNAATRRFQREAKLAAGLNHPSLVTVHSLDAVDDVLLLAMELVNGKPLDELLAKGKRWDQQSAAQLLFEMADGLAAVHEAGIVHRDLKPANVMITANGSPKILDFGVAGRLDDNAFIDGTGVPQYGTITYMAPEQVTRGSIGPWTDVFAIGAIGYELITGVPACGRGDPVIVGMRVTSETPPLLTDPVLANEQFGVLTDVLTRTLNKDRNARFPNARSLASALQPIVESTYSMTRTQPTSPAARVSLRGSSGVYPGALGALRRKWLWTVAPLVSRIKRAIDPTLDRIGNVVLRNSLVSGVLPTGGLPLPVTRRMTLLAIGLLVAFGMTTLAAVARAGRNDPRNTPLSQIHVIPSGAEVTVMGPPRHALLGRTLDGVNLSGSSEDSVLLRFSYDGFAAQEIWFTGSPLFVELEPIRSQLCGVVRADPPGTRITTDDPTQPTNETTAVLCVKERDSLKVDLTRSGYASRTIWFRGQDLRVTMEAELVLVRFESNRIATVSVMTMDSQPIVATRRTPFSTPLSPGTYRVRYQVNGLTPRDSVYTIGPTSSPLRIRREFELETAATTGVLRVWVQNGWARVSVNGGAPRLTATTFPNLPVGQHVLELTRPNGETRVDTVYVGPLNTPGDTTRVGYTADLTRRLSR